MGKQEDFVLRALEERDVRFVRLWFTDVWAPSSRSRSRRRSSKVPSPRASVSTGRRSRASPASTSPTCWPARTRRRSRSCRGGALADGAPRGCSARSRCRTARSRTPTHGSSCSARSRRRPSRASRSTPTPRSSSSCSRTAPPTAPRRSRVDHSGYFDHTSHETGHDFRRAAIMMLEDMGISVEFSHHEGAPGQQEIDLRYADALTTADNIMTFRVVVKEVALSQGLFASFMPKPFTRAPRVGDAHPPVALRGRPQRVLRGRRGVPPVEDRSRVHRRPAAARRGDHRGHQPVGQLLQAAAGGGEAPSYVCWGHNNRSALVRVPMYKPTKGQSTRVELRSIDSAREPVPGLRGHAGRRDEGHRGGLRAAARRRGRRVGAHRRASGARWASTCCRRTCTTRSR